MITIVAGTDTGAGKTVATAALAVHFGPRTLAVKPVQTGLGVDESDIRGATPGRLRGGRVHPARGSARAGHGRPAVDTPAGSRPL